MNILKIMKKNHCSPSLIIYTNLLQLCFSAKNIEMAIDIYDKIVEDKIKSLN